MPTTACTDMETQHQHVLDSMGDNVGPLGSLDTTACRKLAVLGLPWDTSEDTLRDYFSQFGALEAAEVMKDRYTGKSRGFGFVCFAEAAGAMRALSTEHSIDGRRCEAKIALPKGDPSPPRTTRIFVARIPPTVTETQFRSYFESFGRLQDAYMPKDHTKQGYRGIGFVTYACADSVEKIMAVKHWLNGHEIAIDRATPKEEPSALKNMFTRVPGPNTRRSFDNGAGIIGPGLVNVGHPGMAMDGSNSYGQLRALSEDRQVTSTMTATSRLDTVMEMSHSNPGYSDGSGMGLARVSHQGQGLMINPNLLGLPSSNSAAANVALHSLAKSQHDKAMSNLASLPMGAQSVLHHLSNDISASLLSNALSKATLSSAMGSLHHPGGLHSQEINAAMQQLIAAAAVAQAQQGRRSLDAATAQIKRMERMENPAITNARAGPRIFIGKLTKETSELDVREYFSRFGFVLDVYLPKAKDNKVEHRGFGFVTFETEAAIQRVVQHGTHRLKGSTIAIDLAMPKVDDEGMMDGGGMDGGAAAGVGAGAPMLTLPQQLSLMQRMS